MGNLVEHAKRELDILGMGEDSEDMNKMMYDHIIKMVEVFEDERHSGFSASYAASALDKLLRFEPLAPLQGTDDEWNEVGTGLFQNNRCSHVFKENGQAYDSHGKVFVDSEGHSYIRFKSRVNIEFPYSPTREIVQE